MYITSEQQYAQLQLKSVHVNFDLTKTIITSATSDAEEFGRHFADLFKAVPLDIIAFPYLKRFWSYYSRCTKYSAYLLPQECSLHVDCASVR